MVQAARKLMALDTLIHIAKLDADDSKVRPFCSAQAPKTYLAAHHRTWRLDPSTA